MQLSCLLPLEKTHLKISEGLLHFYGLEQINLGLAEQTDLIKSVYCMGRTRVWKQGYVCTCQSMLGEECAELEANKNLKKGQSSQMVLFSVPRGASQAVRQPMPCRVFTFQQSIFTTFLFFSPSIYSGLVHAQEMRARGNTEPGGRSLVPPLRLPGLVTHHPI